MMFREMRRNRQQLTEAECIEILRKNTSGVLAVSGDSGYPYAVPLSYVYDNCTLYFHCGKSGHKLDAINTNSKVSFCVIDQDLVVPHEYTTYFRSVIIFGLASVVNREDEIHSAIEKLAIKYYPGDSKDNRDLAIQKEYNALCIVKIQIEHMTGKEAIELISRRR